jgi:alpha-galactosidase
MRVFVSAMALMVAQLYVAARMYAADSSPAKIALPPAGNVPYNGLAKTPPMGWNSGNAFGLRVSDRVVRETADAMVRHGMKDAGYVYINIDDGWQGSRDALGNLEPNQRFPAMKALADYIHARGLKFGLYSSPGPKTCAGYPGSFQHEEQDTRSFAAWGVDYLKYDWCSAGTTYDPASMPTVFARMGLALLASGRPIVYSIAGALPNAPDWAWAAGANLWPAEAMAASHAGPGHWNDPDVPPADRTQFSLWCLLAAPLLVGNDLASITPAVLEILTNKEAIAVDQDALGAQGTRVKKSGDREIWAKPLADGGYAVGLFNRGPADARMVLGSSDLGIKTMSTVRDLWAHEDRGETIDTYSADVPAHGVVLLRVKLAR